MIPRFYELGEDLFEDLCRELVQEEPDVEAAERYGTRKGQRQMGIDLLIEFKDKTLAAGQCKSHERCDERLIRTACNEFVKHADHWREEGVGTFILFIAADTRHTQLHDERLRQRATLGNEGFSFKVWSGAVFKAKLRRQRQIVRSFFPYLEDYICGSSGAYAARKLDQSADRKVIHLRAVHFTLFSSETPMIGCGNVGISRAVRDFQAAVEIVL